MVVQDYESSRESAAIHELKDERILRIFCHDLTRGHKKREPLLGSLLFGIRAFESDILSHLTFIIPKLFFEQRKIS
jgi:hypothetical protein